MGTPWQGQLRAVLYGCLVTASPGTESLSLLAFFKGPCVCSLHSAALEPGGGPRGLRSCCGPCCATGVLLGAWMCSCSSAPVTWHVCSLIKRSLATFIITNTFVYF